MEIYTFEELFESMTYKRKTIKDALRRGFVVFEYTKKDGSHRKAFGTLMGSYILQYWKPKGVYCYSIDVLKAMGYIQYWDLERNDFRQFRVKKKGVDIVGTYSSYGKLVSAYPALEEKNRKPKYPIYKELKAAYPPKRRKRNK